MLDACVAVDEDEDGFVEFFLFADEGAQEVFDGVDDGFEQGGAVEGTGEVGDDGSGDDGGGKKPGEGYDEENDDDA